MKLLITPDYAPGPYGLAPTWGNWQGVATNLVLLKNQTRDSIILRPPGSPPTGTTPFTCVRPKTIPHPPIPPTPVPLPSCIASSKFNDGWCPPEVTLTIVGVNANPGFSFALNGTFTLPRTGDGIFFLSAAGVFQLSAQFTGTPSNIGFTWFAIDSVGSTVAAGGTYLGVQNGTSFSVGAPNATPNPGNTNGGSSTTTGACAP